MRTPHTSAAVLLAASLALAGCGGAADSGASADHGGKGPAAREAATGPGWAPPTAAGSGGAPAAPGAPASRKPAAAPQHVVRTAELSMEVRDATAALATARTAVQNAGGHVDDESTRRVDDERMTSRIVLRVPQAAYDRVLRELAGGGKLLSRTADARDVTDQVVDVESRIASQRASVARVRELMDRATRLSDVVTLEGELSSRQAALESLLAQQASLKDRTALATVTLLLSEPGKRAVEREEDDPDVLDALGGGWQALVTTATWVGIALAALAPWAAVALVGYVVWRWLVRPRWPKRSGSDTAGT
ncbi:DUF4349 domain-containing protein [Streptomyces sp. HMX112]|uniref:DUF4349 domain-containing protein n=1 Tax=Streptomyces sp. HMX112 TaxID=3390850 RepID=UPI003A8096B2